MRNNDDRLGAKSKDSSPAATSQSAKTGPAPLDFVRPVTVLALPSEGKLYPESHPLHNQDTIEIRQMTAAEEDILTNRTLLKKGLAIDKFLERIMIDCPVGPNDLLVSDKNAVLIQARIDGYGPAYKTRVTCPACQTVQKKQFNLFECLHTTTAEVTEENVEILPSGNALVETSNGWQIEIRPLVGSDESSIVAEEGKNAIQKQLQSMIVSVSGHSDTVTINKAIEHLGSLDSRMVRKVYSQAFPTVGLRSQFQCRQCDHNTELEVPLNAEFFWTDL